MMIVRLDIHLDTQSERDANDVRNVMVKVAESLTELLLAQVVVTSEVIAEERDPYGVYGTPEHEALLIAEERGQI